MLLEAAISHVAVALISMALAWYLSQRRQAARSAQMRELFIQVQSEADSRVRKSRIKLARLRGELAISRHREQVAARQLEQLLAREWSATSFEVATRMGTPGGAETEIPPQLPGTIAQATADPSDATLRL
jgi:uncharacterized membrane protein